MNGLQRIRRDFSGTEIELLQREDGQVFVTSEQLGLALGYKGDDDQRSRSIRKLAERHQDEIRPFKVEYKLTRDGVTKRVVAWERTGVYLFAMWARTDKAKAFRAWILKTCDELEKGDKVLVDRSELGKLHDLVLSQAKAIQAGASLAGSLLANYGHRKARHPELYGEDNGQTYFGYYEVEFLDGPEADAGEPVDAAGGAA